jgi:hypothetical protein
MEVTAEDQNKPWASFLFVLWELTLGDGVGDAHGPVHHQ